MVPPRVPWLVSCVFYVCIRTAQPTQEQLFDADCEDAGDWMLRVCELPQSPAFSRLSSYLPSPRRDLDGVQMRDTPEEYTAFISANQSETWDAPLLEPVFRRVEHICNIVMKVIETHARQGKPLKGTLSQRDVSEFRREMNKRPLPRPK